MGNDNCLGVIITALVGEFRRPLQNVSDDPLFMLLQDPFGNYVIQTALHESTTRSPRLYYLLATAIKGLLPFLKNAPYAKRIQVCVYSLHY